MIAFLIDKCHVAWPYSRCLRFVISKIEGGKKKWRSLPRQQRREIIELVVRRQNENRNLYREVMCR